MLAKAFRRCFWSPYAPDIFSAMYSKSFRRTLSGKRPVASMRLIVMADNPEVLCIPRMNRPGGAARQTEDVGLFVERDKATLHQRPTDFLNL